MSKSTGRRSYLPTMESWGRPSISLSQVRRQSLPVLQEEVPYILNLANILMIASYITTFIVLLYVLGQCLCGQESQPASATSSSTDTITQYLREVELEEREAATEDIPLEESTTSPQPPQQPQQSNATIETTESVSTSAYPPKHDRKCCDTKKNSRKEENGGPFYIVLIIIVTFLAAF